jgi:hypothetical protein
LAASLQTGLFFEDQFGEVIEKSPANVLLKNL